MIEVEICINSDSQQSIFDSVGSAYNGGAARVELCSAMHLDGLTPKMDQIISARKAFNDRPGLMVMIRPRTGDFVYTSREVNHMTCQIHNAAEAGADGIVIGALRAEDNSPDTNTINKLMQIGVKYNFNVTFHRAFDATLDPFKSIEVLINLGIDKVLTSGTRWGEKNTALDGADKLKQIIEISRGRIEIVICGGININNVNKILRNLPIQGNKISIHSYSGVQDNGITKLSLVKSLVDEVRKIHQKVQLKGDLS